MSGRFGLYLHIPFCRSKCAYCDFASFPHMEKWQPAVIERMAQELRDAGERLNHRQPTTVYVGGGTPSVLPPELFERLMRSARDAFPWEKDAEVSVEMNPGTVSEPFLAAARRCGVNRVSLGAQSADDRLLQALGRIHRYSDIQQAVQMLKDAGFSNFNLDMMIGLPCTTLPDTERTLEAFIALGPKHLSCYSLIVEDGTPMADMVNHGTVILPDEELERRMYYMARDTLAAAGYRQYEISNFAKEGYACRHNLDCWHREEYLGIGVGAASLIGHERFRNPGTIFAYMAKQLPERITLSETDEQFESVMLGLRLIEGISDNGFYARHRVHLTDVYGSVISSLIGQGLLEWKDQNLRCTPRGLDIQNDVLTSFLPD